MPIQFCQNMLLILCLLNIVLGAGNCTNFSLCDTVTQYLMTNADSLPCEMEVCNANDNSTCCGERAFCTTDTCDGDEGYTMKVDYESTYCAQNPCVSSDMDTCCVKKGSSRGSWNFLMIYLIVLVIGSVFCFIGYKCRSSDDSGSTCNSKESNVAKTEKMLTTKQIVPESDTPTQADVVLQSNGAGDEEDGGTGRVYLL